MAYLDRPDLAVEGQRCDPQAIIPHVVIQIVQVPKQSNNQFNNLAWMVV